MSDLDVGIVDRRTVIVAIVVFILAGVFFHYPVPVRTSELILIITDIAFLTGYVYLARTIMRAPVAILLSI